MVKNSNNTITLTKQELKDIIHESIMGIIDGQPFLLEMAHQRKDVVNKVKNLTPQIIQNWCLVRYASIVGKDLPIDHWRGELRGYMKVIEEITIKGNNTENARLNLFYHVWSNMELFDNPQMIEYIISKKFKNEKIDTSSKEVQQVIFDFLNEESKLLNILARTYDAENMSLQRYIDGI